MILDKMLRRSKPMMLELELSAEDIAFKKLAKKYRLLQKDLENVKDYALELQKKNRELMVENQKYNKTLISRT